MGLDQPLFCRFSSLSGLEPPDMSVGTFSHPDDNTPLSTPLTRLEPTAFELTRFFRSLLRCGQPSASQSLIFITFIASAAVLLSLPFPGRAKWPSSTQGWDIHPIHLTNGNQIIDVSSNRAPVYCMVARTHGKVLYLGLTMMTSLKRSIEFHNLGSSFDRWEVLSVGW